MFLTGIWGLNILKNKNGDMIIQKISLHRDFLRLRPKRVIPLCFPLQRKRRNHRVLSKSLQKQFQAKSPETALLIVYAMQLSNLLKKGEERHLSLQDIHGLEHGAEIHLFHFPDLLSPDTNSLLYRDVLNTQVERINNGLFPNTEDAGNPAYNSVDAPLWFFWTVQQYILQGGTDGWELYGDAAKSILSAYKKGTEFNIHMRDNGLIYADAPGKPLTWMDAVVDEVPVTPRSGYAVEINALWYNAVCFSLEMARIKK